MTTIKRLCFTLTVLIVLTHAAQAVNLETTAQRPNILVLMAEDMSAHVGAFGDAAANTPNLDQLAQEGVRYPNTFTTAGVCAPSRAAHITGMHQIAFGGQHQRASSGPLEAYKAVPPAAVKAYPELLRAQGYFTWTDSKLDYQFSSAFSGTGPFTVWDEEGGDGFAGWRERAAGQPFYGLINFPVTHESGVFEPLGEKPHSAMHLLMQSMRAATAPSNPKLQQAVAADIELPPYYPDTPAVRDDLARHYNNIAVMDWQVGEILRVLEEDGLADSTIVVWTTDHGDGLPRAKRELYDSGIKVPMIVRWPKAFRPEGVEANSLDARMVSFIDIAPTLLRLAGAELPTYLQGQDFVIDTPRNYVYASRDRIDEVSDRQRAVRGDRYKYIRSWYPWQPGGHALRFRDNLNMMREMWQLLEAGELNSKQSVWFQPPGEEQLYDLQEDPFELHNLINDPTKDATRQTMRDALDDWLNSIEDWSDQSEAEMMANFMPNSAAPVTALPEITFSDGQFMLHSASEGASMGYRTRNDRWQLYTGPVDVSAGTSVTAKAVRYGWQESASVTRTMPRGSISSKTD